MMHGRRSGANDELQSCSDCTKTPIARPLSSAACHHVMEWLNGRLARVEQRKSEFAVIEARNSRATNLQRNYIF